MEPPAPPTQRRVSDGDFATAIRARLDESAGPTGFLPFDRFMEIALYAPGVGYYERHAPGPAGDFYTVAHTGPLFARCLAKRLRAEYEALGQDPRFRIVEVGPGDGTLAAETARALLPMLPSGARVPYLLVERSRALREAAMARLESVCRGGPIEPGLSPHFAADGPFVGVLLANELLDALPAKRFVRRSGKWKEIGVVRDGERWRFEESADFATSDGLFDDAAEGTIVERSAAVEGFPREIADHLVRGCAIVIDYGAPGSELRTSRPAGTLAGVRSHRTVDDPLERPGETDLSVFVDSARLRERAAAAGLTERSFRPQREALGAWGLPEILAQALETAPTAQEKVRLQLSAKNLVFGFENFFVLELGARAPGPV